MKYNENTWLTFPQRTAISYKTVDKMLVCFYSTIYSKVFYRGNLENSGKK